MQRMMAWLKRPILRLAVHVLGAIMTAFGAIFAILPFLYLFKWLFGPLPNTAGLPNPIDGWWLWSIALAWLILFWKIEPRVSRWLLTRFGLGRKAGLKCGYQEK